MNITASVTADLKPLKEFRQAVGGTANPHVSRALRQWAARYRSFTRERFDRYSKGGGDWEPLAASTLRARRKGKQGTNKLGGTVARRNKAGKLVDKAGKFVTAVNAAILRDTGVLFAALRPTFGQPGQVEEVTEFGVRVGFGGTAQHPGGGATIAEIAAFHQFGTGRMPARPILVDPDAATLAGMADDMRRALDRISKETGNS